MFVLGSMSHQQTCWHPSTLSRQCIDGSVPRALDLSTPTPCSRACLEELKALLKKGLGVDLRCQTRAERSMAGRSGNGKDVSSVSKRPAEVVAK
jgi:hypothetical protein